MKNLQILVLSLISATVIASCGNSASSQAIDKQSGKDIAASGTVSSSTSVLNTNTSIESNGTVDNLAAAKKAGKAVFLVVTGTGATNVDKALAIAKEANAIYKDAVVIQMDKDDSSNAQLVSEYRLAGAPVPVILVISSKGVATGGYVLAQATSENLAALVPSPKLEEVYAAIASGKSAITVFSKKSINDRKEVLKICKEAISILKNNAVLIEVDMDDSKETNLMNQLRIDKTSSITQTFVINTKGQVSGTATNIPDAQKLADAATTVLSGGCGSGCGPAGCGK